MKFEAFDKKIITDNVQYAIDKITEIIKKIGPRESAGTEAFAAMDPAPADYYHNRLDSYDRLEPATIKAGFDIVMASILNFADEDFASDKE